MQLMSFTSSIHWENLLSDGVFLVRSVISPEEIRFTVSDGYLELNTCS